MKLAKRVFIGLLAVALLTSSIVFATSADASVPEYDDILKYYDPATSTVYFDEDFEGATYEGEIFNGADDKLSSRVEVSGDDDKYIDMISGPITNSAALGDMLFVVNPTDGEGNATKLSNFVYDATIMASHAVRAHLVCAEACGFDMSYNTDKDLPEVCPTCGSELISKTSRPPVVRVFVGEEAHADGSVAGTSLILLDFENNSVLRYDGASYTELDFVVEEGKWYNIHIVYEESIFALTITDAADSKKTLTVENMVTPMHSVGSLKIGYSSSASVDGRDSIISVDDVYLQSGNDYRNATPEELEALTKAALLRLQGMLEDATVTTEMKFNAVSVYDTLVDVYGYTSVDPEVLACIEAIENGVLNVYAQTLASAVDTINTRLSYEERLAHVANLEKCADRVREYLVEGVAEEIEADLLAYDTEVAALATDKENSERFIAFVNEWIENMYDFYSEDYAVLEDFYSAAKEAFYVIETNTYTYNSTYPGISDAFNNHVLVRTKFESMKSLSEAFVGAVNELKSASDAYAVAKEAYEAVDPADADALALAAAALSEAQTARLAAYADARVKLYENVTCPGVADAIAFYEVQAELNEIGEEAEHFLSMMAQAAASINLDAKEAFLDMAEALLATVAVEYPGVKEAMLQYDALRQSIADARQAAADYIAAVEALEGLEGDALVAAVENALLLQKTGNIIEIAGVVDANIALNNIHSSLLYAEACATKFITLVGKIDSEATIAERYAAIKAAEEARDVPNPALAGVSAAEAMLDGYIADYNADIESVNSSFTGAVKTAADFAGAPVTLPGVGALVASFIKSIIS